MLTQISAIRYRRSKRLQWKNKHSRRLQQSLSDPNVFVAWDSQAKAKDSTDLGCWILGRLADRYVVEKYFRKETVEHVKVVVPITTITTTCFAPGKDLPVQPSHPKLLQWIRSCDAWVNSHVAKEEEAREELEVEWRRQSAVRDRAARSDDMAKILRPMVDNVSGFIGREAEGGARKHFYAGCLY